MKAEFTAIYNTRASGVVTASVAELPNINTGAPSLEEARASLTEKLRMFLEGERRDALSRIGPGERTDTIRVEYGASRKPADTSELLQCLLEAGLIDEVPSLAALDTDAIPPIPVEGRPISEEIIEDRR